MSKIILGLVLSLSCSVAYSQEWIGYVAQPVVVEQPPVVYTVPRPPVVVNKWVPYYYSPVISVYDLPVVERRGLFFRRDRIVYPTRYRWFNRSALYYGY